MVDEAMQRGFNAVKRKHLRNKSKRLRDEVPEVGVTLFTFSGMTVIT